MRRISPTSISRGILKRPTFWPPSCSDSNATSTAIVSYSRLSSTITRRNKLTSRLNQYNSRNHARSLTIARQSVHHRRCNHRYLATKSKPAEEASPEQVAATAGDASSSSSSTWSLSNIVSETYSEMKFFNMILLRLGCAFSISYIISEYFVDLTICEGPSMLPTIKEEGEIVLLDRFTPRLWGINGGFVGNERRHLNKQKQKQHEEWRQKQQLKQQNQEQSSSTQFPSTLLTKTWFEPRIPIDKLPTDNESVWKRLRLRLTTGISVGDVVVVQHPDRIGTVCKRVVGLPGDTVTKDAVGLGFSSNKRRRNQRLQRRKSNSGSLIIPNGHVWLEGDNPNNSTDSRVYGPIPSSLIVGRVLLRLWPLPSRGGNPALLERGDRPTINVSTGETHQTYSGTIGLPAGYNSNDQVEIVREHVLSAKESKHESQSAKNG